MGWHGRPEVIEMTIFQYLARIGDAATEPLLGEDLRFVGEYRYVVAGCYGRRHTKALHPCG